jgi:hypothetical protein
VLNQYQQARKNGNIATVLSNISDLSANFKKAAIEAASIIIKRL